MARFSPGKSDSSTIAKKKRWILALAPWLIFLLGISQLVSHLLGQDQASRTTTTPTSSSITMTTRTRTIPLPQQDPGHRFFLVAVIFNRVFSADLFNITSFECQQWIEFMSHAGVDHIYWYDTAHDDSESQEQHLRRYVDDGSLTYHRFYSIFPAVEGSDFHYEQDNAYAHFLANYNRSSDWAIEMDVDEYPFSPSDHNPGFLPRFLRKRSSDVSQILLQCMLFLGNPLGDPRNWVIERYQRRKRDTEGKTPGFVSRQKPIFRPALAEGVTSFDPHKFLMREGKTVVADEAEVRMNHYWGPRLTDFGPDTPAAVEMLVGDSGIQGVASYLKRKTNDLRYNRIQRPGSSPSLEPSINHHA